MFCNKKNMMNKWNILIFLSVIPPHPTANAATFSFNGDVNPFVRFADISPSRGIASRRRQGKRSRGYRMIFLHIKKNPLPLEQVPLYLIPPYIRPSK
jgi:hypothetical protein